MVFAVFVVLIIGTDSDHAHWRTRRVRYHDSLTVVPPWSRPLHCRQCFRPGCWYYRLFPHCLFFMCMRMCVRWSAFFDTFLDWWQLSRGWFLDHPMKMVEVVSFGTDSKPCSPEQTAPKGALWSGSTLFDVPSVSFKHFTRWHFCRVKPQSNIRQ